MLQGEKHYSDLIHTMYLLRIQFFYLVPGSHVGFQISTKNTNLVEDHPMSISGKFGWNLFSGLREEDLNVKS
jgi:hypothetical protein